MIALYVVIGLLVVLFFAGIRIVRPTEEGRVEFLGKRAPEDKVRKDGFHWIIPVIQKMYTINITERMVDIRERTMITKDNLNVSVDAVVYFKVKNTYHALYNVDDFRDQIVSLAQTTARNIIGTLNFEQVNSNRDKLNIALEKALSKETESWGIDIVRVEVQELRPPDDVQGTMNEILKADNKKVAAVNNAKAVKTEAEGQKWAAVQVAEGRKKAQILEAAGEAKAIEAVATARAKEIEYINKSADKYFIGNAVELKKLEAATTALKDGTKYILEKDDVTMVLSDAAGMKPVPIDRKGKSSQK